jgi:hypothetical protein
MACDAKLLEQIDDICRGAIYAGRGSSLHGDDLEQLYEVVIDYHAKSFFGVMLWPRLAEEIPDEEYLRMLLTQVSEDAPRRHGQLIALWSECVRVPWKLALRDTERLAAFLSLADKRLTEACYLRLEREPPLQAPRQPSDAALHDTLSLSEFDRVVGPIMDAARKLRGANRRLPASVLTGILREIDESNLKPVDWLEGTAREQLSDVNKKNPQKAIHTFEKAFRDARFKGAVMKRLSRAESNWKQKVSAR